LLAINDGKKSPYDIGIRAISGRFFTGRFFLRLELMQDLNRQRDEALQESGLQQGLFVVGQMSFAG